MWLFKTPDSTPLEVCPRIIPCLDIKIAKICGVHTGVPSSGNTSGTGIDGLEVGWNIRFVQLFVCTPHTNNAASKSHQQCCRMPLGLGFLSVLSFKFLRRTPGGTSSGGVSVCWAYYIKQWGIFVGFFWERIMCHKLKIGLIRVQELFIGRGRFSWGVGGFFSKIRNLGSRQSCLYNCLYLKK